MSPNPSAALRTDIAAKASKLPEWFTRYPKGYDYKSQQPSSDEIENHLVDWVRLDITVDDGHIWQFPETGVCKYRLTKEEIECSLPKSQTLLSAWRRLSPAQSIRKIKADTKSCTDVDLLKYLSRKVFEPLSELHHEFLVPNDRYICSRLWEVISQSDRETLALSVPATAPQVIERIRELLRLGENLYYTAEDVKRYPFVPPTVAAVDYEGHPWKAAFCPTQKDTYEEAKRQLSTLDKFRTFFLKTWNGVGRWDGNKLFLFDDPNNYLEINPKAPPRRFFRSDQSDRYTREAVIHESNKTPTTNLWDTSTVFEQVEEAQSGNGPGGLPEFDWRFLEQDPEAGLDSETLGSQDTTDSKQRKTEKAQPRAPSQGEIESQLAKEETNQTPPRDMSHQESSQEGATGPSDQVTMEDLPQVTPRGEPKSIEDVTSEDVSIEHRPATRSIFNGHNAGQPFTNGKSQERAGYETHLDWPIVNSFPDSALKNPTSEISLEDFHNHCKPFTVLPDFWKGWALRLGATKSNHWRLDFNAEGTLAQNFTPHGAACTLTDDKGVRRFVIWNRFQLHGDVGERRGLKRKRTAQEWTVLSRNAHPVQIGKKTVHWCLGDICPSTYLMPENWDVLGQLPSRKRFKMDTGTNPKQLQSRPPGPAQYSAPKMDTGMNPEQPQPRPPGPARNSAPKMDTGMNPEQPQPRPPGPARNSAPKMDTGMNSEHLQSYPPRSAQYSVYRPTGTLDHPSRATVMFPKGRPSTTVSGHEEEISCLRQSNARLLDLNKFADEKIKALTMFGAHQDNMLWLLALKLDQSDPLMNIISKSDQAVVALRKQFPTLEKLVTEHGGESLQPGPALKEWLKQDDHIEMEKELQLRK